ncbi:MAG: ATP-binding protein [Candidatus Limnocylindrales bacterium]
MKAAPIEEHDQPLARSSTEQLVAQQATLAHIGQQALQQSSLEVLFADACILVGQVLDTELVALLKLSDAGDSLHMVEGVGWRPGIVGEFDVYTIAETQSGYTIASGGPVIVPDLAVEKRFKVWSAVAEHGAKAGMSVRVGAADKPYGALSAYTTRVGRFTRDEANFLQAVANVIGAAVERDRIENELRTSRDQLAAIVGSIDEGITMMTPGGLLFANDAAAHLSGFESGAEMATVPPSEIVKRFDMFGEDGAPLRASDLPTRRAMAGEESPEAVVGFRVKATGEEHWSSVRSTAVHDAQGGPTHVITTFRDITEERWASKAGQFMADVTSAMAGTLEIVEAARRLADLAVPQLADYCTVDLLQPDGSVESIAFAHADPARLPLIEEARSRQNVTTDDSSGAGKVIREGAPELLELDIEKLEAANASERAIGIVKALELRSYLCVPLVGRHGPIGALTLVMAQSGRTLGARELGLATDLGVRAGVALENAQLYRTANDRRAQLDTVLAALEEAVIVYDGAGKLRLGNRSAAGVFEGVLPTTLAELWQRLTPHSGTVPPEGVGPEDGMEVRADSGLRWFEMRRYGTPAELPLESGANVPSPTVIVLRDVTQTRAARAAREAFMGVLSHELRTPITTIYGGSQLLERGLAPGRSEEVIADIRAESERLVRLVEDLLVMTRVERGIVETSDEPVLLQHLLASIVSGSPGRWGGARISLDLGPGLPAVRGDSTYIEQVVRNYLTNALRYGKGAEKGIEISAQQSDHSVVVRVLDRGAGLDGEDQAKLFELFYRSSTARAVPGGAGIGLFVSRQLVEAMGGHTWAVDRPDGGAEFGFTLPVYEAESVV